MTINEPQLFLITTKAHMKDLLPLKFTVVIEVTYIYIFLIYKKQYL